MAGKRHIDTVGRHRTGHLLVRGERETHAHAREDNKREIQDFKIAARGQRLPEVGVVCPFFW